MPNKTLSLKLACIALSAGLLTFPSLSVAQDLENKSDKDIAAEAAKELANPNTALAALNFKFQYNSGYEQGGDSFTTLFQPALPFPLENGDKVIFRPAIPFISNNLEGGSGNATHSGVGDIAFDLAYAPKLDNGNIAAFGVFAQLPTGSEEFSADQFAIGPEIMLGKATQEHVFGAFPSHLWGVTNGIEGSEDINKTSLQLFYVKIIGGGWTLGSSPMMSYDWNNDQAEIPINVNVSKTVVMGGKPWKLGFEANYYVEKDEKTRPDFMIGFNVSPVVNNALADLF
ncbi:transporter [Vibrio makurazakiensis]|uniref:transporter n=1 Tax=Vibrio makurazakiensis TaxID=2910250 RepID=UPI003D0EBF5A